MPAFFFPPLAFFAIGFYPPLQLGFENWLTRNGLSSPPSYQMLIMDEIRRVSSTNVRKKSKTFRASTRDASRACGAQLFLGIGDGADRIERMQVDHDLQVFNRLIDLIHGGEV